MKIKHLKYPLSILTILMPWTACLFESGKSDAAKSRNIGATNTIRAVSYLDNGAVVPFPDKRQVMFTVEDSTKIFLTYNKISANADSTHEKITLSDAARCEDVYDNLLALADLSDGIDIKPGKQPCVGNRSIDISVIFENGDTTRFSIMGGARCDPSLCPPFWALDSLTNLLILKK